MNSEVTFYIKDDFERLEECLKCEYIDRCMAEIDDPKEYVNRSCRQKDIFKAQEKSRGL